MLSFEELANFCKRKGIVYPSADLYGGFAGFWDFGALGVEIKNNIKKQWWKYFVQHREDVVGIDGAIITNPKVWEASGHVDNFSDEISKCTKCGQLIKADDFDKCTKCGSSELEELDKKNLMFKTNVGSDGEAYLRPETAQLIFTNFRLIAENERMKLPFGIAQIGKAFRNEISPRDFIFRSREFEQMELQFFVDPKKADECEIFEKIKDQKIEILTAKSQEDDNSVQELSIQELYDKKIIQNKWHGYWLFNSYSWFLKMGITPKNLRLREHKKDELAHYARAAIDIEFKFENGWKEIFGSHDRGQFDLEQQQKYSNKDLRLFDQQAKEKVLPLVIESSFGLDRPFIAFLLDAYDDDKERGNIVLHLNKELTPKQIAVFPLVNKLNDKARKVFDLLKNKFICFYDKGGSIGRRYARQDEIGTPYCVTFDFDSLDDNSVTIRFRDSTKQERVKIDELVDWFNGKF